MDAWQRLKLQDKVKAGQRRVRAEKAARGNRCEDCGGVFHPHVLEFAHKEEFRHQKHQSLRQGKGKSRTCLARFAANNVKAFVKELGMCRLLCANCHRMETYRGRHFDLDDELESEDDPQGALF